ncbi:MAG: hypothetical protein PHU85_03435 [Phycisphaerae bacterium]|nr:hypothetical protein [Phycisphaerae bacterium]
MPATRPLALVAILIALAGCDYIVGKDDAGGGATGTGAGERVGRSFFNSPQDAVPIITRLLTTKDWLALSQYYDLTGTKIDRVELDSGRFFWRADRPAVTYPGIPWEYRHPFPPGYQFDRAILADSAGTYEVTMKVQTTAGGGLSFRMRKTDRGYQILPDNG